MNFFGGREDENKGRQKYWSDLDFLKAALFDHILLKLAHPLFDAWSFLLVHVWFTPSEKPKGFVN